MSIQNMIINTLIISIPEEFFITTIILILLGRYDFLDKSRWKENLFKIMIISVIPMAIVSNVLKYLNVDSGLTLILGIFLTAITINIICKNKKKSYFMKILLMTFFGFLAFMVVEILTGIVACFGLHIDFSNISVIDGFIICIPERMIQYGYLFYKVIKENSAVKINIFKLIYSNKSLMKIDFVLIAVDIIILFVIFKYIILLNILRASPIEAQLLVIIVMLSSAIIIILAILLPAICIYQGEKYIQKYKRYDE